MAQIDDLWTLSRDAIKQPLLLILHLVGWAGNKDGGMLRRNSFGSFLCCRFARFPPMRDQTGHHATLASITLLTNLSIESGGVVASLVPALLQILGKCVHLR